jgi:hypothetical protein
VGTGFCLTNLSNVVTSLAVFKKGFTQFLKNVALNGRIYVEFSPTESPLMFGCRAGFQVLLKTVASSIIGMRVICWQMLAARALF